ncbi:MAG: hypothetical protein WC302_00190 [Candidatus Paceibacterota bacterium]|jgi:hypothetical protein
MDKKIKQILKDIYSIDKSLQPQEEYLIKLIQELLLSKPDSAIDENFVSSLRARVLEMSKSLREERPRFSFSKLSYAFAGTAVILLALISFINLPEQSIQGLVVDRAKDNAFGEITFSADSSEESAQDYIGSSEKFGLGGAGDGNDSKSAPSALDSETSMVFPDLVNYEYVYAGEDFDIQNGKVTVYKKTLEYNDSLSGLLKGIKLDGVDIGKFSNLKVDSIQISEDKDQGYILYAYPKENIVYIGQNWEKWPGYYDGRENQQSSFAQLPDSKAIEIADKFLSNYNIDHSAFGSGEVIGHANIEDAITESATVVYPLQIEGNDVYSQSGYKYGLNVVVDFRTGKVANVSNINAGNFQSSDYDSDLTKEQIISYAKKGGIQGSYVYEQAAKTVEIRMGTPIYALVQTWKYDGSESFELLVPSLIFPVENIENYKYYYGSDVVVPLVGGMMEQEISVPMIDLAE